jgi:hypothetical protein
VTRPSTEDELAVRELAARYAGAVDRRDERQFLSAFSSDARLRVAVADDPAASGADLRGHDQLRAVVDGIARFSRTFHFVGNATYEVEGNDIRGEVYCQAHHQIDGARDLMMLIRYQDRYRRQPDGRWLIADRQVIVDWADHLDTGTPFWSGPETVDPPP